MESKQAKNERQARLGKPADDELVGDGCAQCRARVEVSQVGADRVARGERRRVLDRRAVDLDAKPIGDDDRAHGVVLDAAREKATEELKLSFIRLKAEGAQRRR